MRAKTTTKPTTRLVIGCPVPHCGGSLVRDLAGEWVCLLGGDRHAARLNYPNTAELEAAEKWLKENLEEAV